MKSKTKWIPKVGDWFILKASYCAHKNDEGCTNKNPCSDCLEMCNRFVISSEHYGKDFFFGAGWCNRNGGCICDETYSGVLTFDRDKVDGIAGIHHVSEAIHIPIPEVERLEREVERLRKSLKDIRDETTDSIVRDMALKALRKS